MVSKIEDSHIQCHPCTVRFLENTANKNIKQTIETKASFPFIFDLFKYFISFFEIRIQEKKQIYIKNFYEYTCLLKKPKTKDRKGSLVNVHIPTYEKTIIHKVKWSGCYLCIQETVPYFWGISIEGQDRRRRLETEAKAKVVASLCGYLFNSLPR